MFGEFRLATSRGTQNPNRFVPALTCLEDRTTPAPMMQTKVVPLFAGSVGCDAFTPVVYAWTQKSDPYVLMLTTPEFRGSFSIIASTAHGVVVQEGVRPINGFIPFVFPQGGATDLVVLAKADSGQQGVVPYLLYGQLGFFYSDCPPQHHQPAHPDYPAAPPVSPPPYVPPPSGGLEEFSVTSIFLDGQPGPGLEEIGRFSVGPNPGTVETFVVRDDQGGFAGVLTATVALRRYDEAVGAFGPSLGTASIIDAYTLRVTGIGELINPSASDNQFSLSVDLAGPLQLNSAKAFGTIN